MSRDLSIADYVRILKRRWWIVAVLVCVCAGLAFLQVARQPTLYRSSASVLVTPAEGSNIVAPGTVTTGALPFSNELDNQAVFARGADVIGEVIDRTGLPASTSVVPSEEADVLTFVAESADPEDAALIANTHAEVFIEKRREALIAEYTELAAIAQEQLDEIDASLAALGPGDTARVPLERRRDGLIFNLQEISLVSQLTGGTRATLITPAFPASAPFQPDTGRDLTLGLLLGLLLGLGAAFLREFLDDRLRVADDLELVDSRLVPLAAVPKRKNAGWGRSAGETIVSLEQPDGVVAEAYRALRAAVLYQTTVSACRMIQITSATHGEGKSTTAVNLAVALARTGKRVILVDGDLRRPRCHVFFEQSPTPGVTDVLLRTHTAEEAACIPIENLRLALVPAGSSVLNPSEMLGSAEAAELMATLGESADLVLIDSPPLLAVSDAQTIAQLADATILVSQAKRTRARDLQLAIETLDLVDSRIIGAVLNRAKVPKKSYHEGYVSDRPIAVAPERQPGRSAAPGFDRHAARPLTRDPRPNATQPDAPSINGSRSLPSDMADDVERPPSRRAAVGEGPRRPNRTFS